MGEASPFFAGELGLETGRLSPTTFDAPEGSNLFVLGTERPGWKRDFDIGEYVQIEQADSVLATDRILRFRARLRGPATMPLVAQNGPYGLSDGQTSVFRIDEGVNQTALFSSADFASIGSAEPVEVAAVINRQITGARARLIEDAFIIESESEGRRSRAQVVGGSAGIGYSETAWRAILLINGTEVFSTIIRAGDERDLSDFGAGLQSFGTAVTFTFRLEVFAL